MGWESTDTWARAVMGGTRSRRPFRGKPGSNLGRKYAGPIQKGDKMKFTISH